MKVSILIICILVPLIIISPLIIIWSLNTLFLLDIEYTVETWLAMLLLECIYTFTVKILKPFESLEIV